MQYTDIEKNRPWIYRFTNIMFYVVTVKRIYEQVNLSLYIIDA